MSKEASTSAKSSSQDNDAAVATVLSMNLRKKAQTPRIFARAATPANVVDEADDLWDNVPV